MKECRIIHINDGNPLTVVNQNRFFAEEFSAAAVFLDDYLKKGWEVRQIIPNVTPNITSAESPGYPFFDTGFIVYLEREQEDSFRKKPEPETEDQECLVIDDEPLLGGPEMYQ